MNTKPAKMTMTPRTRRMIDCHWENTAPSAEKLVPNSTKTTVKPRTNRLMPTTTRHVCLSFSEDPDSPVTYPT